MPVSLTKSFLALAMAFNLLLSNLTAIAKAKKPLCQWNWQGIFFQLATKLRRLNRDWKSQVSETGDTGINVDRSISFCFCFMRRRRIGPPPSQPKTFWNISPEFNLKEEIIWKNIKPFFHLRRCCCCCCNYAKAFLLYFSLLSKKQIMDNGLVWCPICNPQYKSLFELDHTRKMIPFIDKIYQPAYIRYAM